MVGARSLGTLPRGRIALALSLLFVGACDEEGLNALAPAISADPNPIDFGQAFVGIGASVFVQIQNVGTAQLEVSGLRLAEGTHPGVSVVSEAFALAPSEKREVRVQFVPTAEGPATGAVLVDSNDPDTPVYEIPIQGQGARRDGPVISVCTEGAGLEGTCQDPWVVDFGVVPFGQTREATIVVRSVGSVALDAMGAAEIAHPSVTSTPRHGPRASPSTPSSASPCASRRRSRRPSPRSTG